MKRALAVCLVCLVACGKSGSGSGASAGGGDAKSKWLAAKLVPTTVEEKGTKIHIDIPDGLPQNTQSVEGPDWVQADFGSPGPRFHARRTSHVYASVEELARDVEPDPKRLDLVEVAKSTPSGGRFEYVSATNDNRHLDVSVWIPLDANHGLQASCHWYAGSDAKRSATPDAELIAWLTKICEGIHVGS